MKNLNSWRIEYIRTKSIRVPFTPKAFFCFSPVRCAGLSHDDRLRCHGLPRSWVVTTVFRVMKSLVRAMKTVVMPAKGQISFGIFRPASTFVCYRRFSGSLVFPQCQDFLLFGNKRTLFFYFLPTSFYQLLINPDLKEENVKHESSGISFQIEKRPNKGYCLFWYMPVRKSSHAFVNGECCLSDVYVLYRYPHLLHQEASIHILGYPFPQLVGKCQFVVLDVGFETVILDLVRKFLFKFA